MKFPFLQLSIALGFLGLVGCATNPANPKKPAEAPNKAAAPEMKAAAPAKNSTPAANAGGAGPHALPEGEFALLVESVPTGGTVVVNGIPVGRAPQRVVLPGSVHGFFRYDVSLKVRFIATDATHTSQTVEELLTPLDRIPAVVRFTPNGATRVAR